MYVEIKKDHERSKEFLNYVLRVCPEAVIHEHKTSMYIDTQGVQIINFFSCVLHDAVIADRDNKGELKSFPLEMFGTIYEM